MANRIGRRPSPLKSKKRYHHGDLRAALVQAAIAVITERGVGAFTLRRAAQRANVSHAAPAHHFGDVRGFLAAIAAQGYRQMAAALDRAARSAARSGNAAVVLQAIGVAYVRFSERETGLFQAMFHPLVADKSAYRELATASAATFGRLVAAIEAAQAQAWVKPGDPSELALTAWSLVHGLAVLRVDDQLQGKRFAASARALATTVTAHLFAGLRPSDGCSSAMAAKHK